VKKVELSKNDHVLSIDQGTHATRAVLFTADGKVVADHSVEISLDRVSDLVVNQNGEELLSSVRVVIDKIFGEIGPERVISAALATQRSTLAVWDRDSGDLLAPLISWQDRRNGRLLETIEENRESIKEVTGLFLSPHYGASKMRWVLDDFDRKGVEVLPSFALAPLATWLTWSLTKEKNYFTDETNGARTSLISLVTRNWSREVLSIFGLQKLQLPEVVPVVHPFGHLERYGTPLNVVIGDQQAAALAYGELSADSCLVNLGSGAFVLAPTGESPVVSPRLPSGVLCSNDKKIAYILEGTVNGAATAIDWLFQQYGVKPDHSLYSQPVEQKGIPLFLNHVGGVGSPFWISSGESRFVGGEDSLLARLHGVVESIVFYLVYNIEAIRKLGPKCKKIRVSGGLSNIPVLLEKLSGLSGAVVEKYTDTEATARGAAWLACGKPLSWCNNRPEKVVESPVDPYLEERYHQFIELIKGEMG